MEKKPEDPKCTRELIERDGKKFARFSGSFRMAREIAPGKTEGWFSVSSETPCMDWVYLNGNWQRAYVVLSHSPGAIDMTRMDRGINLRDGHGGDQCAKLENVTIRAGKLGGTALNWSVSERAQVLRADYENGVRDDVSLEADYSPDALSITGEKNGVPVVRCASWTPLAAALAVATPADPNVGTNRTAEGQSAKPPAKVETEPVAPAKPIEAPAVVRSKTMEKTPEQIAAEQRADAFKLSNEVHAIVRDFTVPKDVADGWLEKIAKGETDLPAIMRETLQKYVKRSVVTTEALATGKVQREQIADAASGFAPEELATKFNLRRAMLMNLPQSELAIIGHGKTDFGLERETQQEMLRVMRSVPGFENYAPRGAMIPMNIRREIQAQGGGVAASVVSQNLMPQMFIDVLRDALVVVKAGATLLTGLQGDVKIPRKSGKATAGWTNGEVAVPNSEMTLEQLTLTPRTVGAYSDMSRQALIQSTPAIDGLVMDDLTQGTARAAQVGALLGTGATGQPSGIKTRVDAAVAANPATGKLFTVGTAGTPTFAELLAADSVLGDYNVEDDGTIAWVMPRRLFNTLCALPRVSTGFGGFMAARVSKDLSTVIDVNAQLTNAVTKNMAFYGRWSDLVIGHWNAFELIVDPYSLSTKGALRIVAFQSLDCQVRYDGSFTYCASVGAA